MRAEGTGTPPVEIDLHDATATPADSPRPEAVSERFRDAIPRDFAREHLIVSLGRQGQVERLAAAESTEPAAVFNVGVCLGAPVETVPAQPEAIASAIDAAYGRAAGEPEERAAPAEDAGELDRLLAEATATS